MHCEVGRSVGSCYELSGAPRHINGANIFTPGTIDRVRGRAAKLSARCKPRNASGSTWRCCSATAAGCYARALHSKQTSTNIIKLGARRSRTLLRRLEVHKAATRSGVWREALIGARQHLDGHETRIAPEDALQLALDGIARDLALPLALQKEARLVQRRPDAPVLEHAAQQLATAHGKTLR